MQQLWKQSRKITLLLIVIALGVGGCSKDDDEGIEPDINPTNSLVYKGHTYRLNDAGYSDYGFDGSHYNQEFYLFQFAEDDDDNVPVHLFLDLYSASEQTFQQGIFSFADYEAEDVTGKHYFDDGYLILNMRISSADADEIAFISGGTVKVAGSGNNYKIEFDLMMNNGESVKGSYGGTFERVAPHAAQSGVQGKVSQWMQKAGPVSRLFN